MSSDVLERAAAPQQAAPRTTNAVFTGIGVTAPNGLGTEAWWAATLRGEHGIRPVRRFDASGYPATLAGEVPGFDASAHIPSRLLPQTDHQTRLALVATQEALDDSGIDTGALPEYAAGVVTASSAGGFEFGQRELEALWSQGGQYVSAYQSFAWFYAVNSGQISIRHKLRGPSGVLVSEGAGGLDAVAQARRQLRRGSSVIVTGGVDGAVCPWGWTAQLAGRRLSTSGDPERAYVPFDAGARGHVPGEGGAILVLEDEQWARERGARVYGRLAGYAATFDPRPGTGGESGLRRAAELALADAGLPHEAVDVVFADAAGLPDLDRAEADAITAVFGPRGVPVTAPKTMTGRLAAGGASLDLAAALLSIRDSVLPPTVHVHRPAAGIELDLVTGAARERREVRTALVLARGAGGFNAAAVVAAP
ncbi:ketosynthase chain-length factor [Streptomyces spororaveus]|uniref:ketosynthase chain-length factor n=1 Tax=Streptomyces spororaveus TaxID=284039 RepID=UPI0020796E18|nr:ketosynthase chain-length factor [Streptomyces spororaveus]MCM9082434.1 ketosynthase chain-length factor [Streptomyces spororaveus]